MEETKITSLLLRLGITPDLRGFQYLVDAIQIWNEARPVKPCMTKEVLPRIAAKYGTSWENVERNIRTAIYALGARVPMEDVSEILGVRPEAFPEGFNNSQFIALCALKLKGGENNG